MARTKGSYRPPQEYRLHDGKILHLASLQGVKNAIIMLNRERSPLSAHFEISQTTAQGSSALRVIGMAVSLMAYTREHFGRVVSSLDIITPETNEYLEECLDSLKETMPKVRFNLIIDPDTE